jgi:hypothetical protein
VWYRSDPTWDYPVTLVQPGQLAIGLVFLTDITVSRKKLCQSKVFMYEKFQLCQPRSLQSLKRIRIYIYSLNFVTH